MRKLLLLLVLLVAPFGAKAQSLSASPSSLYAGQSETTTWSGIAAPATKDWIGLYVPGAADTAYVSWRYTDGSAAGSVPYLIPVAQAAGTYELRIFSNDSFTRLATSNSFAVTTPPAVTLSASPSSADAGTSLTAAWNNIVAPTTKDWIGLFPAGATDTGYVSWRYTDGSAAGSVPYLIPVGSAAGTYELRLFSNDSFTRLAVSNSVPVTTPPPATLSASPSSVFAGQSVTAAWTNIVAPTTKDWIGFYVPRSPDTAFISWRYTTGDAAGSVPYLIPVGQASGTYELRLFSNDTFTRLATSGSITVTTPPPATLSVNPTSIPPGGTTTATWTNIVAPTATDWIGLYLPGAADNAFISWRYTTGAVAGNGPFNISASVAPGTYQLRLFSNDGFTRLATSANFTVGTTAPALYFIHVDHLNTPRLIADASQQTVWKWDQQEPFGNDSPNGDPANSGSVFDFALRLPGQYADKETSLAYNYFRDFDPLTGRYVQSDPIGLSGGLNTYLYAKADPLMVTDVTGRAPDYWWRPCNSDQKTECVEDCRKQGKEYEDCAVRWGTYTGIVDGKPKKLSGPLPNGLSCSCKEPGNQPAAALSCGQNCQKTWKLIRDAVTGIMVLVLVCALAL